MAPVLLYELTVKPSIRGYFPGFRKIQIDYGSGIDNCTDDLAKGA